MKKKQLPGVEDVAELYFFVEIIYLVLHFHLQLFSYEWHQLQLFRSFFFGRCSPFYKSALVKVITEILFLLNLISVNRGSLQNRKTGLYLKEVYSHVNGNF